MIQPTKMDKQASPMWARHGLILFSFPVPGLFCPGTAFHYHLNCHSMTARLAGLEEVTITLPGIIIVDHIVGVIIPIECNQKAFYMDAFTLFSIAFCFLSLADHA
jgi:hypothetical protein